VVAAEARHARGADGTYTPGVLKEDQAQRRAQEKVEKDLERMEELEEALDVVERWTTESAKWGATVEEFKRHKYAVTLNALELLIVERIFELTKMNQSQTGRSAGLKKLVLTEAQGTRCASTLRRRCRRARRLSEPQ
jgi:hypothetical protein